jgi:predicted dehydrogenase
MPTAGPLRVGLIGAGEIAHYHLLAWQKAPDAAVVALCDRDLDRADEKARAFGIDAVFADAATMLEACSPSRSPWSAACAAGSPTSTSSPA